MLLNVFLFFLKNLIFAQSVSGANLRLMTFNLWHSGTQVVNGLQQIIEEIKKSNADVVAVQELNYGYLPLILAGLGPEWSGAERIGGNSLYPDSGIISQHIIDKKTCAYTLRDVGCLQMRLGSSLNVYR